MEPEALIEAILFVAEEPITTNEFAEVLELPLGDVDTELHALQTRLRDTGRGHSCRPRILVGPVAKARRFDSGSRVELMRIDPGRPARQNKIHREDPTRT